MEHLTLMNLPNELLYIIFINLSYSDIMNLCMSYSKFEPFSIDEIFWKSKWKHIFNGSLFAFLNEDEYKDISSWKKFCYYYELTDNVWLAHKISTSSLKLPPIPTFNLLEFLRL